MHFPTPHAYPLFAYRLSWRELCGKSMRLPAFAKSSHLAGIPRSNGFKFSLHFLVSLLFYLQYNCKYNDMEIMRLASLFIISYNPSPNPKVGYGLVENVGAMCLTE